MRAALTSLTKALVRVRRFPALARRRGATFMLDPRNWIDNRLLAGAPYEDDQLASAAALVEEHQIDTFVDVGANIGLYSVLIGRLPRIERVIAVEPVRRNFNQLAANIFANRMDAKTDLYRVALGERAGTSLIHVDPTSTGVSRLDVTTAARDARAFRHTETVAVARFDDVIALSGRRVFLKIDVEGHAAQVLAGMPRFLADNYVVVQIELHDADHDAIGRTMADLNFVLTQTIGPDGFFARP
jgi:FkbM family methyltransferase